MRPRCTRFAGGLSILAIHVGVACLLAAAMACARSQGSACGGIVPAQGTDSSSAERAERRGVDLFVARRGWHVDVGFAVDAAPASLQSLVVKLPGARYVFLGFGDRRYLRARHRVPAMLAALWPGRGLILATGLIASPAQAFGESHVVRLHLSQTQWSAAGHFIRQSFGERRAADAAMASDPMDATTLAASVVGPGPYAGSLYFSSSRTYSAAHTCNTWVAEVLHSAGLPVRSRGVVFAGQVWGEVRRLAAAD